MVRHAGFSSSDERWHTIETLSIYVTVLYDVIDSSSGGGTLFDNQGVTWTMLDFS